MFKDNVIFKFRPFGAVIDETKNVTVDHNLIGNIEQRTTQEFDGIVQDKEGCIATCSHLTEVRLSKCPDTFVTNNILAGCYWLGASLIGHECGKPELSKATGNVVHSIGGALGGVGAVVFPDSVYKNDTCFEAAGIISYKNNYQGVMWQSFGPIRY